MLRGSSEREKASSHYALGKVIKAENPDYSIFCELSQRREQGGYLKIKKGGSQTNHDSLFFDQVPVHRHLRKTSPSSIIKNPASMHKKSHRLVTQVFDKIVQKAKFSCSFIRQTFVKVLRVSNRWERRRRSGVLFPQTLDGKGLFSPFGFRPGLPEMIAAVCCSRSRNQKPRVWRAKKKCTRIACV